MPGAMFSPKMNGGAIVLDEKLAEGSQFNGNISGGKRQAFYKRHILCST